MTKTYSIMLKGPQNSDLDNWQKNFLTGLNFSIVSEQSLPLLFLGAMDDKVMIQENIDKLWQIIATSANQFGLPPTKLSFGKLAVVGNAKNELILEIEQPSACIDKMHQYMLDEMNKMGCFSKVQDKTPFKVYLTLGYKRLGAQDFSLLEKALLTIKTNLEHKNKNDNLLLIGQIESVLKEMKETRTNQLSDTIVRKLVVFGVPSDIIQTLKNKIAIDDKELSEIQSNFFQFIPESLRALSIEEIQVTAKHIFNEEVILQLVKRRVGDAFPREPSHLDLDEELPDPRSPGQRRERLSSSRTRFQDINVPVEKTGDLNMDSKTTDFKMQDMSVSESPVLRFSAASSTSAASGISASPGISRASGISAAPTTSASQSFSNIHQAAQSEILSAKPDETNNPNKATTRPI